MSAYSEYCEVERVIVGQQNIFNELGVYLVVLCCGIKHLSLPLLSYTKKLRLIKQEKKQKNIGMCCLMALVKYLDGLSKKKVKTALIKVMFRKKSGLTAEKG